MILNWLFVVFILFSGLIMTHRESETNNEMSGDLIINVDGIEEIYDKEMSQLDIMEGIISCCSILLIVLLIICIYFFH